MRCPDCRIGMASNRLSCPACHALVYKAELEGLAADARIAENPRAEVGIWRRALDLLPPDSHQHRNVAERVGELSEHLTDDATDEAAGTSRSWKWAGLGSLALLGWKLKSVLLFILTKGKFLLVGLTKSSTLFSMVLSLGVYWAAFGWEFAAGLVVSIYIHEMGHVAALRRLGIASSAPMFIPGLGAMVRMEQYPVNPREDARVGLAGPLWGLAAAAVAFAIYMWTQAPIWGAIARIGAWINLFNLLPVWQLDGGRGFRALSRGEGFVITALVGALWFWTGEGLLLLLLLLAAWRACAANPKQSGDRVAFAQLAVLLVALSSLTLVNVPLR